VDNTISHSTTAEAASDVSTSPSTIVPSRIHAGHNSVDLHASLPPSGSATENSSELPTSKNEENKVALLSKDEIAVFQDKSTAVKLPHVDVDSNDTVPDIDEFSSKFDSAKHMSQTTPSRSSTPQSSEAYPKSSSGHCEVSPCEDSSTTSLNSADTAELGDVARALPLPSTTDTSPSPTLEPFDVVYPDSPSSTSGALETDIDPKHNVPFELVLEDETKLLSKTRIPVAGNVTKLTWNANEEDGSELL